MIYEKPKIYNAPGIYNIGGGGGGGAAPQYNYTEYEEIAGRIYPIITLNGLKWICENLDYIDDNIRVNESINSGTIPAAWYYNKNENIFGWDGFRLGCLYNDGAKQYIKNNANNIFNGWRLPTKSEVQNLVNITGNAASLKSIFWNSSGDAYYSTNETLLNIKGSGYYTASGDKTQNICQYCFLHVLDGDSLKYLRYSDNNIGSENVYTKANGHTIRLVKSI